MDPNEVLKQMRVAVREINAAWDVESQMAQDLADAVDSLDVWLKLGGFLPDDWDPEINQVFGDCK